MRFSASVLAVTLSITMLSHTASAGEWPGWRRDPQRTALASGKADITKPAVRWRYFIGGTLTTSQFLAHDLDGDGKKEVIYTSGGRLVAKEADDTLIWQTKILRLTYIKGLYDFNGDGAKELLVLGKGGAAFIFSPSDGGACWEAPAGTFAQVGAALVANLDGDAAKTNDLYLAENASSSPAGTSAAFSFTGGCKGSSKLSAKKLWTFSYTKNTDKTADRDGTGGLWDALADVDGDKTPEIISPAGTNVHVYDAKTGKHRFKVALGSQLVGGAWVVHADLDGDKDAELVMYTNRSGSRRVWVMDYDKTTKTLVTRWERKAKNEASDSHGLFADSIHDLNGDGTLEVVTSFQETGTWRTLILDGAAKGAPKVLATVSGEYLVGLPDLDGDGRAELVTSKADASAVSVRTVAKTGWTLGAARTVTAPASGTVTPPLSLDRDRWATQALGGRVIPWDADLDKKKELLLNITSASGSTLEAYDFSGAGAPVKRATHTPGAGIAIFSFQPTTDVGEKGTGPQLLTTRSDGNLVSLGKALAPTNSLGSGPNKRDGVRVGGYMGAVPLVTDLDGDGKPEVLTRDSRGKLLCLDPTGANLVTQPTLKWAVPAVNTITTLPAAADLDGDGKKEVLVGETPNVQVVAYTSSGAKLWSYPANVASWSQRLIRGSLLWGDVSGDKVPDVIYITINKTDNKVYVGALHGKTGKAIWPAEVSHVYGGCGEGHQSLADLDGDGVLDVVLIACKTMLGISGKTGTVLNPQNVQTSIQDNGPANLCGRSSGVPMLLDLDGDKKLEAVATGNFAYTCALSPSWDGKQLTFKNKWTTAAATNYKAALAAPVKCGGTEGVRLVAPRLRSSELDLLEGKTGKLLKTLTVKASSLAGYLTSAAAHADLAGDGKPKVLLGSDDGYLYAISPCGGAPTVAWSLDMKAPVNESVLGDTNGDGKDEILVASQDGFLNALTEEYVPAPAYVYDNDGTGPAKDATADIDAVKKGTTTLYANWASVAKADSYEFAVVTSFGTIITKPAFIKVGNKTEGSASGLKLEVGQRYFVAVRALNSKTGKTSAETKSDGVLVLQDPPKPSDAGVEGGVAGDGCPENVCDCPDGCNCTAAGPESGGALLMLLALLGLARRTRRRRR